MARRCSSVIRLQAGNKTRWRSTVIIKIQMDSARWHVVLATSYTRQATNKLDWAPARPWNREQAPTKSGHCVAGLTKPGCQQLITSHCFLFLFLLFFPLLFSSSCKNSLLYFFSISIFEKSFLKVFSRGLHCIEPASCCTKKNN